MLEYLRKILLDEYKLLTRKVKKKVIKIKLEKSNNMKLLSNQKFAPIYSEIEEYPYLE